MVPVGERALTWLERYLDEVRPRLMLRNTETAAIYTQVSIEALKAVH